MVCQKIQVLKFASEQKYTTLDAIRRHLGYGVKEESLRVALYTFGLSRVSYGAIKHGIWYVSDPKVYSLVRQYYPRLPFIRPVEIHPNEISHALGMNDIRYAIEHNPDFHVVEWLSEFHLRALPPQARFQLSYQTLPDAIFFNREANGSLKKYFIEFERSLKNRDRYRKIIRFYSKRPDVTAGSVLYISPEDYILNEIRKVEQEVLGGGVINEAGKFFRFIHYDSLVSRQGAAHVV